MSSVDQLIENGCLRGTTYPATICCDNRAVRIDVPDGQLCYAPHWFSPTISAAWLNYCLTGQVSTQLMSQADEQNQLSIAPIQWHQDTIKLYGKQHLVPRLTAWYGDEGAVYAYSGLTLHPHPWNKPLLHLREQLKPLCDHSFNSVLLNCYRSGQDHMGWHRDNQPMLGTNPTIASVSFGATRRFLLRRYDDPHQKFELTLSDGSVLVMSGTLQHHWQHRVPKETKVLESRVNLTFRHILTS